MIWLPLRFYLSDFIKKLALATLGGIIMGLFLLGPLADTLKEKMLFFNWSLTITLYGTFFYTYPLLNISKWYMNAPVSKGQWFIFNCVFQFMKFFLTATTFATILFLEKYYFPAIPIQSGNGFGESMLQGSDLTTREAFKHSLLFAEDFMSSSMIGLVFTLFILFISFIFNVDPYGPFRGGIIGATRESVFEALKKWWQNLPREKIKKWWLPFTSTLVLSIFIIYGMLSKALSFATVNTLALFLVFLTYDRAFTFSNRTRKFAFMLLALFFFGTWQGIVQYSVWISKQNVSVGLKLQEMEFQGRVFAESDKSEVLSFLKDPDLDEMDLQRLVILAQKSYPADVIHPYQEQILFDNLLDNPFKKVARKEICLNNKKLDGALKCLNLITTHELDFDYINNFLDHLWQLEGKDELIHQKSVARFIYKEIPYSDEQIMALLKSTNPYKQNLGLHVIEERNRPMALLKDNGWHKGLKEANYPLAKQLLSKVICYPLQSIDLALGTFLKARHPASCMMAHKMKNLNH